MSLSVAAKMSVAGPPGMQAFNVEPPAAAVPGPRGFFTTERLMAFMALLAIGLGVLVNQVGPKPEGGHPASEPSWRVFDSYGLDVFHRLVKLVGTTWISMLQLAVLPYIGTNMVVAMADFKEAGEGSNRLVVKTVAYCLTTTFIACLIGLAYALLILIPNMPDGLTYDDVEMEPTNTKDVVGQIEGIIQGLIPKNIVLAGASTNLLGVIFFFTVVGYTIEHTAARPSYLFMALKELNESMNKFILAAVAFAPIAVFCLLYVAIATIKDIEGLMASTAVLCGICFLGSGTMILVVYPTLFFIFNRTLPVAYYLNSAPAMVTALSTSSSAATLPVTIHCTIKNNGVKVSEAGAAAARAARGSKGHGLTGRAGEGRAGEVRVLPGRDREHGRQRGDVPSVHPLHRRRPGHQGHGQHGRHAGPPVNPGLYRRRPHPERRVGAPHHGPRHPADPGERPAVDRHSAGRRHCRPAADHEQRPGGHLGREVHRVLGGGGGRGAGDRRAGVVRDGHPAADVGDVAGGRGRHKCRPGGRGRGGGGVAAGEEDDREQSAVGDVRAVTRRPLRPGGGPQCRAMQSP